VKRNDVRFSRRKANLAGDRHHLLAEALKGIRRLPHIEHAERARFLLPGGVRQAAAPGQSESFVIGCLLLSLRQTSSYWSTVVPSKLKYTPIAMSISSRWRVPRQRYPDAGRPVNSRDPYGKDRSAAAV